MFWYSNELEYLEKNSDIIESGDYSKIWKSIEKSGLSYSQGNFMMASIIYKTTGAKDLQWYIYKTGLRDGISIRIELHSKIRLGNGITSRSLIGDSRLFSYQEYLEIAGKDADEKLLNAANKVISKICKSDIWEQKKRFILELWNDSAIEKLST